MNEILKGFEVQQFHVLNISLGDFGIYHLLPFIRDNENIQTATHLIKEISSIELPPSKLDIGLLTAEYLEDSSNNYTDFIQEKLKNIKKLLQLGIKYTFFQL